MDRRDSMSFATLVSRLLVPADRLVAALTDPSRRARTAAAVLIAYAAVWSLYGAIAKSSQDLHFDMGEAVSWSRELSLGYPKHPPLSAWLVRAWFSVFPSADWSYYLFAIVLATLGLWIAWKLSAYYLEGEKRVVGLALLTLVPFFNFHALKFNANTVLIPVWAAATWWFLRSYETRSIGYAALAGLAAAAAMLGKYWSILLLAGLVIAALADPRRKAYFRSAAPWVTVAVGSLALAPHLVWLIGRDFGTFDYALLSHATQTRWDAAGWGVDYIVGALAYIAVPILLVFVTAKPGKAALADMLWPENAARRTALMAFALPLLLPFVVAIAAKSQVVSLWAMSAMTLLPVVLLSSPRLTVPRAIVIYIVAIAVALPVLATLFSPVIAFVIHQRGVPNNATHYQMLAAAIEQTWRATTDRPLLFVGGNTALAYGAVFYLSDRPQAYTDDRDAPIVDPARVARSGIALVCLAEEQDCIRNIETYAGAAGRRIEVELVRSYFGVVGPSARYLIVTVPPRT
jgi:4-amino-4-deoxy-L-arabinose transferase-like glycosyltransferase